MNGPKLATETETATDRAQEIRQEQTQTQESTFAAANLEPANDAVINQIQAELASEPAPELAATRDRVKLDAAELAKSGGLSRAQITEIEMNTGVKILKDAPEAANDPAPTADQSKQVA